MSLDEIIASPLPLGICEQPYEIVVAILDTKLEEVTRARVSVTANDRGRAMALAQVEIRTRHPDYHPQDRPWTQVVEVLGPENPYEISVVVPEATPVKSPRKVKK